MRKKNAERRQRRKRAAAKAKASGGRSECERRQRRKRAAAKANASGGKGESDRQAREVPKLLHERTGEYSGVNLLHERTGEDSGVNLLHERTGEDSGGNLLHERKTATEKIKTRPNGNKSDTVDKIRKRQTGFGNVKKPSEPFGRQRNLPKNNFQEIGSGVVLQKVTA